MILVGFRYRANGHANRLLAILIGLMTVMLWNLYIYKSGLNTKWLIIDRTLWVTPFLWTPMLYAYVVQMTRTKVIGWRGLLVHALPALFVFAMQFPLKHLTDNLVIGSGVLPMVYKYSIVVLFMQMGFYIYLCLRVLQKYRLRIKSYYSAIDAINLTWLRNIVMIFTAVIVLDMIMYLPTAFLGFEQSSFYNVVLIAEACSIFLMGYLSLSQVEILMGPQRARRDDDNHKYQGSTIDPQTGVILANKLDTLMETSQIFKKNDLRLGELADKMDLSSQHLSQIINQYHQKNFYDYVNEYRVRSAAADLIEHGKINLTKLAFDSGFNNRVSFNNAFKKYIGLTPTAFLREQSERTFDLAN